MIQSQCITNTDIYDTYQSIWMIRILFIYLLSYSSNLMFHGSMYSILIVYLHCYEYSLVSLLTTDHIINEFINDNTEEYGKLIWGNESYRQVWMFYFCFLSRILCKQTSLIIIIIHNWLESINCLQFYLINLIKV